MTDGPSRRLRAGHGRSRAGDRKPLPNGPANPIAAARSRLLINKNRKKDTMSHTTLQCCNCYNITTLYARIIMQSISNFVTTVTTFVTTVTTLQRCVIKSTYKRISNSVATLLQQLQHCYNSYNVTTVTTLQQLQHLLQHCYNSYNITTLCHKINVRRICNSVATLLQQLQHCNIVTKVNKNDA